MPKVPQPTSNIAPITFSFAYYDIEPPRDYCLSCWPEDHIAQSLARLKEISRFTPPELNQQKPYRFHPVDWSKTTEKGGFPDSVPRYFEPYQFALVGVNSKKARVFGGFYQGVFYIVWFDHEHEIWEMDF